MPSNTSSLPTPLKLKVASVLARSFIESHLVILIIISLLLFGLLGLTLTPREENPQIVVPVVDVSIAMPGALPEEIEHLILTPLENRLNSIEGVKHIYGMASHGLARIKVEFEVGEDKTKAFVRLYDQVLRFKKNLPIGALEPHIQVVDVDDVPIMTITLASTNYSQVDLTRVAENLYQHLGSIKNIGKTDIVGSLAKEIRVIIDPVKLASYKIEPTLIHRLISDSNIALSLGNQNQQYGLYHIRINNHLTQLEDLKNLVIKVSDKVNDAKQVVRLQDVATITDQANPERSQMVHFNFGRADPRYNEFKGKQIASVTLAIAKRPGSNSVDVAKEIRQRINMMKEKWLPKNIEVIFTRDDGKNANDTVNKLIEHLFIAIAAVSFILLLFLGIRAALIVMMTIPLIFAVVMGLDWLAGPTLNRITLYALILALGMLVDDAIVVIENIHRHYQKLPFDADKIMRAKMAVKATGEIGNPTTLATFTVVIVFLSLLMVTGMLGEFFYPIAFNLPVAMITSLLVAYIVIPWSARRFLPNPKKQHENQKEPKKEPLQESSEPNYKQDRLQKVYTQLLSLLCHSKLLRFSFYSLTLLLLFLSLLQPAWQFIRSQGISGEVSEYAVPLAFLPKDNKNTFVITIHSPDASSLENTQRVVSRIEQELQQHPLIINYESYTGISSVIDFNGQLRGSGENQGEQFAEIRVNLIDKTQRSETSIAIVQNLRKQLKQVYAQFPDTIIQLVEDPPGPPVRATVLAEIYGLDNKTLRAIAKEVEEEFKQTWDMAEVWTTNLTTIPEYQIHIKQQQVALSGVSITQVAQALASFIKGETLGYLHTQNSLSDIPIKLMNPTGEPVTPNSLSNVFIKNNQGKMIPLSLLVEIIEGKKSQPILHQDMQRVVYVGGELYNSAPVYAILALDKKLDGKAISKGSSKGNSLTTTNLGFIPATANTIEGYKLHWSGELRLTLDAFRDMGIALGLSLVMIYLLLVGYYHSFTIPLLVMISVPLAMIGVFPAHWLFDITFSAASMIGVIALAGIVVRNSLLIVDFIQELRKQGIPLEQAVKEAGSLRLRPILLTTLAIALGTAIMVPDPVFGGLAISLIAGSMSSALFTVFIVPLLYRLLEKNAQCPS